jgi:hypothetical protein
MGPGSELEDNLAKVGVEGSNPFARSSYLNNLTEFDLSDESTKLASSQQ